MAKPEATEFFGPAVDRLGMIALGAVLTRFGSDKPMTLEFWIFFSTAVLCVLSAAWLTFGAAKKRWARNNELTACTTCRRMQKRDMMQEDPVTEQVYCRDCDLPHWESAQEVEPVAKTLP